MAQKSSLLRQHKIADKHGIREIDFGPLSLLKRVQAKQEKPDPRRPLHQACLGYEELGPGAVLGLNPFHAPVLEGCFGHQFVRQPAAKIEIAFFFGIPYPFRAANCRLAPT
jgi:hypothetical protein